MNITPEEIKVQIAIGTLPHAPHVLAKLIKRTNSVDLIKWGLTHKSVKVRAAAISNPLCPDIDFLRTLIFDNTKGVHEAAMRVSYKRRDRFEKLLKSLESPQLEFTFNDTQTNK